MIDTRTKIVQLDEARRRAAEYRARGEKVRAVAGYFDPLLPVHIAQLQRLAGAAKLFVIVDSPEDTYLELPARTELAAALSFVECVVSGGAAMAEALGADELLPELEAEGERRQEFIRYVRERAGNEA